MLHHCSSCNKALLPADYGGGHGGIRVTHGHGSEK